MAGLFFVVFIIYNIEIDEKLACLQLKTTMTNKSDLSIKQVPTGLNVTQFRELIHWTWFRYNHDNQ